MECFYPFPGSQIIILGITASQTWAGRRSRKPLLVKATSVSGSGGPTGLQDYAATGGAVRSHQNSGCPLNILQEAGRKQTGASPE